MASHFHTLIADVLSAMERAGEKTPRHHTTAVRVVENTLAEVVERARLGNHVRTPIGIFRTVTEQPRRVERFGNGPGSAVVLPARKVLKFTAAKALRRLK